MSTSAAKTKKPETRPAAARPVPYDPIYDLQSAAQMLSCNERILAQKFRKGEIQATKRLGRWFTTHSNLLAYLGF